MTLKTLDNALDVIRCFTHEHPSWGVRELAKELNVSHSIVYRILATFTEHGFLVKNEETKKYELGIKFWEYGLIVRNKFKISDVIHPIMVELANEIGESIFLTWLDGLEGICLDIAESPHRVKFDVTLGSRMPLYAGASNKVIMAYLPEADQKMIIQQGLQGYTEYTITDPEELLENLARIRKEGCCYSLAEYSEAIVGIAVPLFARGHKAIGSLTIAAPEYRFPESKVEEAMRILRERVEEIQPNLYTIL